MGPRKHLNYCGVQYQEVVICFSFQSTRFSQLEFNHHLSSHPAFKLKGLRKLDPRFVFIAGFVALVAECVTLLYNKIYIEVPPSQLH